MAVLNLFDAIRDLLTMSCISMGAADGGKVSMTHFVAILCQLPVVSLPHGKRQCGFIEWTLFSVDHTGKHLSQFTHNHSITLVWNPHTK